MSKYANVIERRLDDELNLERLIECNVEVKNDCIANGTPYIEIDEKYDLDEILAEIDGIVQG